MINPYTDKERMSIPRDLNDCCSADSTSRELWRIAEKVESWGVFLLIGIIILGLIISVGTATTANEMFDGSAFSAFMYSAIIWIIIAIIEFIGYHLIALFIRAVASIVQNTRVSANVALYTTYKSERINPVINTPPTPPAKKAKTDEETVITPEPPIPPISYTDEEIICPSCGKKQRTGRKVCWSCNQPFVTE